MALNRSQILVDAGQITLSRQFYTDGVVSDPGTVTIGIVDAMGVVVVASGTATTGTGTGPRSYALAAQTEVTVLYVTWTKTTPVGFDTEIVEVIGSYLFTLNQARTHAQKADNTAPLASLTEYPNARVADERTRLCDKWEDAWIYRSPIRRYARVELAGTGTDSLRLSKGRRRASNGQPVAGAGYDTDVIRLISATVSGATVAVGDLIIDGGMILRESGVWTSPTAVLPRNVILEYEYGLDAGYAGIDEESLKLLVDALLPHQAGDRALSWDTGAGVVRYPQEGGPMRNPTRIPSANELIARLRRVVI